MGWIWGRNRKHFKLGTCTKEQRTCIPTTGDCYLFIPIEHKFIKPGYLQFEPQQRYQDKEKQKDSVQSEKQYKSTEIHTALIKNILITPQNNWK